MIVSLSAVRMLVTASVGMLATVSVRMLVTMRPRIRRKISDKMKIWRLNDWTLTSLY